MSANTNELTRGGEACVIDHPVVSEAEWITARKELMAKEKALMRQKDELDAERRKLPWVKVEKEYVFDGPHGQVTLSDLFQGRSQLYLYHFMFAPEWEEGCSGCSFLADHLDAANLHLPAADVAVAVVARAPYEKLAVYKERMGWKFNWVSSAPSDFNYDYHVSFTPEQAKGEVFYNYQAEPGDPEFLDMPGTSVFYKNEAGEIFHTYSSFSRAGEVLIGTYNFLDLMPKGRNEAEGIMNWMKRHDTYESSERDQAAASCCGCSASEGVRLEEPRIEEVEELHLAGMRERFNIAGDPQIPALWGKFAPLIGKIDGQKGFGTYGVVSHFDEKGGFDYMPAVRVLTLTGLTGDHQLTGITLPAGLYAKFKHEGPLREMYKTCGAIFHQWAPESDRTVDKAAPFLEVYPEDFCPDTNPRGVEIWVPLVEIPA